MSRKVEFPPDGKRVFSSPVVVVSAWQATGTIIPATYACATAQHETDFTTNEVDTEESGFVSKGIYQLSDEEAREAGMPGANLLDLAIATAVLVNRATARAKQLMGAISLVSPLPPDLLAFLTVAHNQGPAAAMKTVAAHGLNWQGYKERNGGAMLLSLLAQPNEQDEETLDAKRRWWLSVFRYGDDAITGGRNSAS